MKYNDRPNPLLPGDRRDSGTALITAMIFAFVIGLLSVSYLKLASSEYRAATRSTLYSSSLNLAESGVEMGIAALNAGSVSGSTWKDDVTGKGFLTDAGFDGDVRYVILDASAPSPIIYSEGSIYSDSMSVVTKQVKVELSSGFQAYEKGFAARNGITLSGKGVTFDSYNSDYGDYDSVLPLTYVDSNGDIQDVPTGYGTAGKNKNDDIYVASDLLDEDGGVAVSVGNATVYGHVQSGEESKVSVNKQGMVTTYEGDGAGQHQEGRVLGDFSANFPVTEQPSDFYPEPKYEDGKMQGSDDAEYPKYYALDGISLGGSERLVISGHVVLVMSDDIKVKGSGEIYLDDTANAAELPEDQGSSLHIYSAHDIDIGGNGVTNNGAPADFKVYGTAAMDGDDAGQDIKIAGNGQLAASVYAPNADVTLNGGGTDGDVLGGVVALTAKLTGGSVFHFDEALRGIIDDDGTYTVSSWLEMTGATAASTPINMSGYFD
jgi:hypothetical protein